MEQLLYNIQTQKHLPLIANLYPSKTYNINLTSRTIEVPQFLSVKYDHNAEIVYFQCNRYHDGIDLAEKMCVIQYTNANGQKGLYYVPYYDISHFKYNEEQDISESQLIIPWSVGGLATMVAGTVSFSMRFYEITKDTQNNKYYYTYNLSTLTTKAEVLHGTELPADEIPDYIIGSTAEDNLRQEIHDIASETILYWQDV